MRELQDRAKHLQQKNDCLQAQVEKSMILAKMTCKIAAKQVTQSPAIKDRSPSSLTT